MFPPSPNYIRHSDSSYVLGHLYRQVEVLEYQGTFMGSHAYRLVASPHRAGRPRPHWAESSLTETAQRIDFMASETPLSHSDIHNGFFAIPTLSQIHADLYSKDGQHSLVSKGTTLLPNSEEMEDSHP